SMVNNPGPQTDLPVARTMRALVAARPRQTAWATLLLALVLAGISTQAEFDYSTLSLKDPQSEAMTTLRELHAEDIVTDYSLSVVAADAAEAEALKARLAELEVVSGVTLPADYLPDQQADKLLLLEDASFLLDAVFYASADDAALTDEALTASLHELIDTIDSARLRQDLAPDMIEALMRLKVTLEKLTSATAAERERFTQLIVPPLQAELNWLQQAFDATEVTVNDFPTAMRDRLIAPDDRILLAITPAEDVIEVEALRRFTEAVLTVTPNATGRPVLDLGIGDIVTSALGQALVIAVGSIFIILLLTLRSLTDAVLVFIPLAMTAGVTLTFSVLAGLPLNMANVVVIPLIFGLGVDNGIHIVKRYHQVGSVEALVHSSTPKAVFLSNLTTLGTFCALSFSTHQGIYSIGVLLTIALVSLMLLTLISLPALLATFSSPGNRGNLV
ncbi:MAG: MMPL family transporter, partial [Gammaproteobacteria bacterium]